LIARESQGIPRNINNICFNSLTLGCALQRKTIDAETVREVLADLDIESTINPLSTPAQKVEEPIRAAKPRTKSRPKLWSFRSVVIPAILCAVLPLFAWLIWQDYRALSNEAPLGAEASPLPAAKPAREVTQAVNSTPAPSIAPKVASGESAQAQVSPASAGHGIKLVPVRAGQSLFSICEETFQECRPEVFREIIKINPSISDPNHIVSGQKVAVPVFLADSTDNK
jgi:hypothetical protein